MGKISPELFHNAMYLLFGKHTQDRGVDIPSSPRMVVVLLLKNELFFVLILKFNAI
jgi:hypothetical protein